MVISGTVRTRFWIFFADGHTEKQMIPHIQYKDKTIVFCADLLATAGHIPVHTLWLWYQALINHAKKTKKKFLNAAADNNYLFLEHDAHNQIITVEHTEKELIKDVYSCQQILT
jgi:hypothetical protein